MSWKTKGSCCLAKRGVHADFSYSHLTYQKPHTPDEEPHTPDKKPRLPSLQLVDELENKGVVLLGHHDVVTHTNGGGFWRDEIVVEQEIQALLACYV